MLETKGLTVYYGQVRALFGVDLKVNDGEIVSLIGPNGAGKTSTLNAIAGAIPRQGEVIFEGEALPPRAVDVVRRGVALIPQGRKVFPSMTVEENLLLGGYSRKGTWALAKEWFPPIYEYFPRLEERRRQPAGKLSGGEQQMLVIGRALLANPKLILIDELSLGLAPLVVQTLLKMIVRLKEEQGVTFLLVEQAAPAALEISDRAYLMQKGQVVLEGTAQSLLDKVDVLRSAYLGAAQGSSSSGYAEVKEKMRRVFVILAATPLLLTAASPAALAEEAAAAKAEHANAFDTFDILAQAQGGKGTLFALGGVEGEQNRMAGAKVELSKPAQSYAIAAAYQRGTAAGYTYGAVLGQSAAGGAGVAPEPPPGEAVGVYPSGSTSGKYEGAVTGGAGQTIDVKATAVATDIPSAASDFAFQHVVVPGQVTFSNGHVTARGEPLAEGVVAEAISVINNIVIGPLEIEQMISRAYGLVPAEEKPAVAKGGVVIVGATVNKVPVKISSRGIELADQGAATKEKEGLSDQLRTALKGASISDIKLGDTESELGEGGTSVFVSSGALKVDYNNREFAAQNPNGFGGGGLEIGGAFVRMNAQRHVEQAEAPPADAGGFDFPFSTPAPDVVGTTPDVAVRATPARVSAPQAAAKPRVELLAPKSGLPDVRRAWARACRT